MTRKIVLDPGHGGKDPGAVGYLEEKVINLQLGILLRTRLVEDYICEVRLTRENDLSLSLAERAGMANRWGADFFLALHSNAGGGSGYEDFIYSGRVPQETIVARDRIHPFVAGVWTGAGRPDRGKKRANFYLLRETKMAAMLVENGFVDNAEDARLLKDAAFQKALAAGMARGIATALGLPKADKTPQKKTFYRVIAGSFMERKNAERRQAELNRAGFDSFIDIYRF
ncbi:MAG: N-acetylmuramoyl-L-alanine amidase [Firmicutes bacterium]|jgi:N-acetylmuramoyl-L-alanine amidase|nr:N-acetylmuramoyl-L-alanine amidase [Bacillota bacterium]